MKIVLLYLVLVGLPVLGVVGILRLGGRLGAPPDIGGVWRAEIAPAAQLVPPCVELAPDAPAFDVEQSGVHADVTLNDPARTRLEAILRGTRLWGRAASLPMLGTARAACPQAPLELAADFIMDGRVAQLAGQLWAGGCAACAPVSFRAERVSGDR
ncbi:MAG: hypothetical protein IT386_15175 [Deltaproteobacteria bacterium]|nr:hypothetical protein [Deltaproteobacteria bacterium]